MGRRGVTYRYHLAGHYCEFVKPILQFSSVLTVELSGVQIVGNFGFDMRLLLISLDRILTLRRKVNPSETTELRRHSMLVREALDNLDSWQGETLPPPIPLRWAGDSDVLHSRHSGLLDP